MLDRARRRAKTGPRRRGRWCFPATYRGVGQPIEVRMFARLHPLTFRASPTSAPAADDRQVHSCLPGPFARSLSMSSTSSRDLARLARFALLGVASTLLAGVLGHQPLRRRQSRHQRRITGRRRRRDGRRWRYRRHGDDGRRGANRWRRARRQLRGERDEQRLRHRRFVQRNRGRHRRRRPLKLLVCTEVVNTRARSTTTRRGRKASARSKIGSSEPADHDQHGSDHCAALGRWGVLGLLRIRGLQERPVHGHEPAGRVLEVHKTSATTTAAFVANSDPATGGGQRFVMHTFDDTTQSNMPRDITVLTKPGAIGSSGSIEGSFAPEATTNRHLRLVPRHWRRLHGSVWSLRHCGQLSHRPQLALQRYGQQHHSPQLVVSRRRAG